VCIVPAREIYKHNRNTSYWFISALYYEFNYTFINSKNKQTKMQAWQYVKACVKLLKEMNRWFAWQDFQPGTEAWREWWKVHPEDHDDMKAHVKNLQSPMTKSLTEGAEIAQRLLAEGMAVDDVREAVNNGTY
jgi:hypothetical protein